MAKKKKNGITVKKVTKNGIPMLIVPKDATPRQICRAYKKQFTAAELVKYIEDTAADLANYQKDDGKSLVPMEQVLAEMEQIQREETEKRQKKRRKK